MKFIPQNFRDKLNVAGYSVHSFLLKMVFYLGWRSQNVQKHRYKNSMKPSTLLLRSTRLLEQVWEHVRHLHYSLSTEKAYLCAEGRCEWNDHSTGQSWVSAHDRPLCGERMNVSCGSEPDRHREAPNVCL